MNDNRRFWNIISPLYNRFMRNNREGYGKVAECIAKHLSSDMKVLEIGCGSGEFTELLAPGAKEWVATDFSKQMVDSASQRLNIDNVTYKVEDATLLTFEDSTFDAVMIANTLHVMPDPVLALHEIHRVLKHGGLLFAPTFIFDKGTTETRVKLLEVIGFKVYNKWQEEDLCKVIEDNNFKILHCSTITASPLSELIVIAQA